MRYIARQKQLWLGIYFLGLLFLHLNAILKPEDPIADTQTDAISYDQKMEQDKDGVKAPATPKIIYYGGQGFLAKGSLGKYEEEMAPASGEKKKVTFNWSDWWDDKPAPSSTKEGKAAAEEPVSDLEKQPETTNETFFSDETPEQGMSDDETSLSPKSSVSQPAQPQDSKGDDWW